VSPLITSAFDLPDRLSTKAGLDRLERIGLGRINLASLTINYRTPEEVMAEAEPMIRAVLPGANVPVSIRSTGIPVVHGPVSDLGSILGTWLAAHARWAADVVRLLGAGYPAWLGARMITHARQPLPAATAPGSPARPRPSWRAGLLADLGNPKAAVFWTSLFAAVLPPRAPTWVRVLAIVVVVTVAGAWYAAVACTFSLTPITRAYQRAKKWIDRGTGGVLIGLATHLAAEH
jgi:threonine/homoserine/homoserine lactone efflux protein